MWLIVLAVVVVVVVLVGLALNPLLKKKRDTAVLACQAALGADRILEMEPKANGLGTEPSEAGGLQGMGCLAVSDTDLMFVTWAPRNEFRISRSAITGINTSSDDIGAAQKATVLVTYTTDDGSPAVASWRLPELVSWLTVLDYDFGPEGAPAPRILDDDDD
jgi:hypothetical protein